MTLKSIDFFCKFKNIQKVITISKDYISDNLI